MAQKRKSTARRKPATRSTAAPKRRRRSLNSARPATRRRRRMNSAIVAKDVPMSILQLGVGALAGGIAIAAAEQFVPNYYMRAGGAVVVGAMLTKFAPKAKMVGLGFAAAGVVGAGGAALSQSGLLPAGSTLNGVLNGTRRNLKPAEMRRIADSIRTAGRTNGTTLNSTPGALVGYDFQGNRDALFT